VSEDFFHASASTQLLTEIFRFTFISQGKLVAQIIESIINWGSRQHENLGFNALTNNLIHQLLIASFSVFNRVVVTKIMRLVDHDQIIITPVDAVQRNAE